MSSWKKNKADAAQAPEEPSPAPTEPTPETKRTRRSTLANLVLGIVEANVRSFNLGLKMTQSSISVALFFIHAGENHVKNSQMFSQYGIIYITSVSAFPVYLIARASCAVWRRRWIPQGVDAILNLIACANYLCMFFFVLLNLNVTRQLRDALNFTAQRTKLNQVAVFFRLILNFIIFLLLLFEALTHFFRSKLHKKLLKVMNRKPAAEETAETSGQQD